LEGYKTIHFSDYPRKKENCEFGKLQPVLNFLAFHVSLKSGKLRMWIITNFLEGRIKHFHFSDETTREKGKLGISKILTCP